MLQIGDALLSDAIVRNPSFNPYPPTFAAAMAPVAWLQRLIGDLPVRILWGLGQLACLLYATRAFFRALELKPTLLAIGLVWLCAWRAIVSDLNNQNVTLFLVALLAWASVQLGRGRSARAGAVIAGAASLKLWPAFALGALVIHRPRRLLLGVVGGGAVAALLTLAVFGYDLLVAHLGFWLHEVLPRAGDQTVLNQSWSGLVSRLLGPTVGSEAARQLGRATGVAGYLALIACLAVRRARTTRVRILDAALATSAGLWLLPFAWVHYYCALLPVLIAVLAGASAERRWSAPALLLIAGTAIGTFLDVDVVGRGLWTRAAFFGNAFAGALLIQLAGLLTRERWNRGPVVAAPSSSRASGAATYRQGTNPAV